MWVGLISSMDSALGLVIATIKVWFPVKPEFFRFIFNPLGFSFYTGKIIVTFIKHLHSTKQYISLQTWTLQKRAHSKTSPVKSGVPIWLCEQKRGFKGYHRFRCLMNFIAANNSYLFQHSYILQRQIYVLFCPEELKKFYTSLRIKHN